MGENVISVRTMQNEDIRKIIIAYNGQIGCNGVFEKYINRCFEQNGTKERITFIAFFDNEVAGYVNIIYKSSYPYFLERDIPEIND